MAYAVPKSDVLFDIGPGLGEKSRRLTPAERAEMVDRHERFVEEMTKATVAGLTGETTWGGAIDTDRVQAFPIPTVRHDSTRVSKSIEMLGEVEMAKGIADAARSWQGSNAEVMSKEWTLTNPLSTGLVPYDLEAPAKLLTPRPTPFRNMIPRLKGQGGVRRFKVISGFTGTGTGGATTLQPGINESTTNAGPGGLSYIRGPYISYDGYDVALNYVTTSLSDSVSWQAEYQGQGFEDIRSLSNTALLYSTMLLDERLMIYGRGTTGNGYTGALGTPGSVTLASAAASLAPTGATPSSAATLSATSWVVVAADAGDILGVNGTQMHQGPTTAAASVSVTSGQTIQVTVGTDVTGALGYNLYVGSVSTGPFYYAGRTGYNVGYIKWQPTVGPTATASQTDQSAVSFNYDGLLTNVAASGGYVNRLNAAFSTTNPGTEFQTAFAALYEQVKGDPEEIWMNGFDRLQLSNALFGSGTSPNSFRIYVDNNDVGNVKAGAVVQSLLNQVTGTDIPITVHPWFPQGNALIRQRTLPIPDSNVSETSVMVLPQDYVAVQWPVQQFTYDASTFEIGTFCHYSPQWNGLLQGIQGVGISVQPPSYGDS